MLPTDEAEKDFDMYLYELETDNHRLLHQSDHTHYAAIPSILIQNISPCCPYNERYVENEGKSGVVGR